MQAIPPVLILATILLGVLLIIALIVFAILFTDSEPTACPPGMCAGQAACPDKLCPGHPCQQRKGSQA